MAAQSKFTAKRRAVILEALSKGCSKVTACGVAGITPMTLHNWLQRGKDQPKGTYADFLADVELAMAAPRKRAMDLLYTMLPDNPQLLWKYIERQEPGFAPPMPGSRPEPATVVVELRFSDGSPVLPSSEVIVEGEVLELPDRTDGEGAAG